MPTFPKNSTPEEMVLGQDITPAPEPGTWIVASLVSAFLIWKRRRVISYLRL